MVEVLEYICPDCGKVLNSIYPNQLKAQIINHNLSHDLKKGEG